MAKTPIYNIVAGRQDQIEVPTSTQYYPIGYQIQMIDAANSTTSATVATYEYMQAGTTLVQYGVYTILGTASGLVAGLNTSAGTAMGVCRVVVPQTTVTNGYYAFLPVRGVVTANETAAVGQNYTGGQQLKVTNASTVFSADTVAGSAATAAATIRQFGAFGFIHNSSGATSAAQMRVYLYGDAIGRNSITPL